jgi:hypothetical protein
MKTIAFPQVGAEPDGASPQLTRFAWLSVATPVRTRIRRRRPAFSASRSAALTLARR